MNAMKVLVLTAAAGFWMGCSGDGVRHTPDAKEAVDGAVDAPPDAPLNPAMLSGSPGATDFGDVVIGQTTSAVTYTVSNDGDETSGTISVLVDPAASGFAISDNHCSGVALAMHETCTFAVAFTAAAAGPDTATVHISATPGGELTRDLTGNGLQPGAINITEASHDFTKLAVDATPTTHTFTVKNTGQVATGIPMPSITGTTGTYSVMSTTCNAALAANATCSVVVKFDPVTVGSKPATLVVTGSPGGSDSATLSGIGVAHVAITKTGNGTGMVTSNMTGINCGSACAADFSATPVTLTAVPDTGMSFGGWTGDCAGMSTCTLDLTAGKTATANFKKQRFALTTSTTGNGQGTITLSPSGGTYDYNQVVTVTATPATGSTFDGFGADCLGMTTCTLTMTQAHNVTAGFTLKQFTLTTSTNGTGGGTVTGAGTYNYNDLVTVTASPDVGSTFAGWGGDCLNKTTCTLTMTTNHAVSATFNKQQFALTTSMTGNGHGTLTLSPASATGVYDYNTMVTVTATPATGSTFDGFTGDCTGPTCTVTMTQARNVIASFTLKRFTLTTSTTGAGQGTITGAGTYNYNDLVTVTASAATGSTFTGFNGDCSGPTCSLRMTTDHAVSANFDKNQYTFSLGFLGDGTGTVNVNGTTYSANTSFTVKYGDTLTLKETPTSAASSMVFGGWGGDCASFGTQTTCTLTVSGTTNVTATFLMPAYRYLLTLTTATPNGIYFQVTYPPNTTTTAECSSTTTGFNCAGSLPALTVVNLKAHVPPPTFSPYGWNTLPTWTGCDSVSADQLTCTFTVNATRHIYVTGDAKAL